MYSCASLDCDYEKRSLFRVTILPWRFSFLPSVIYHRAITLSVKIILLCQYANLWQMTKKTWMFVEWYSFKIQPSPSWFMSPFILQCDTFVLLFTLKWIGNFLKRLSVVFQYGNGGFRIFSFVLFACNRERAAPPLAWHRTVALLACPATRLTLNTAASTLAWLTGSLACLRMFAVAEMPKKLKTNVVQACNEKNCHDRLAHQSVVQIFFWYWAHNSYSPIPTVLPVASLKKTHT